MLPPDQKRPSPRANGDHPADHVSLPARADAAGAQLPYPAAAPASLAAPPGLGTMMHALRRSWAKYVPLALLVAVCAAAVAFYLVPGQYVSTIVFRIVSRPTAGSVEDEGNFANVQRAQVASLKGQEVLAEAIRAAQLSDKHGIHIAPLVLQKKLVTNFNDGPELMQVQWAGPNGEAVADLLNAVGEVFPRRVHAADEARVTTRIAQLRKRMQLDGQGRGDGRVPSLAEQLRDKRVELQKAEKDAGLDDAKTLAEKHASLTRKRDLAERELSAAQRARLSAQAALSARQSRLISATSPTISEADVEARAAADPVYADLAKDIAAKKQDIEKLRKIYREDVLPEKLVKPTADLRALEKQRKAVLDRAREKLVEKAKGDLVGQVKKEIEELKEKVAEAKSEEERVDDEVRKLTREVERTQPGSQKVPPDVAAKRDAVEQLEKELKKVGDELAGLEGSLPLTPRVTVHAPAIVPADKDYSRTLKFAVAAALGAFGLALMGLCFFETLGRRVYSSDDVSQGLGLPVVGVLPALPAAVRKRTTAAQSLGGLDPRYGLTEAVDALRTVLLHAPKVDGARVVMITSAGGGEGKTTLASHLAASLARAWRKTLLIDGDLRNPAQHEQFGQSAEPGLAEALRAEVEFEDAVQPTLISRLWLMPAGKADGHALQALAQEGVQEVFDRLKEQYDFIVLDSSPVLPVPDALLLGQHADVVLLSVMKDISRGPAVYQAQQRLEALGIRILGTVIIGEKTETYGRGIAYQQS